MSWKSEFGLAALVAAIVWSAAGVTAQSKESARPPQPSKPEARSAKFRAAVRASELRLRQALGRYRAAVTSAQPARGPGREPDKSKVKGVPASRRFTRVDLVRFVSGERGKLEARARQLDGVEAIELREYSKTLKLTTVDVMLNRTARSRMAERVRGAALPGSRLDGAAGRAWRDVLRSLDRFEGASGLRREREALVGLGAALRRSGAKSEVKFKVVDRDGKAVEGAVVQYRFYDDNGDPNTVSDVTPDAVEELGWGLWDVWALVGEKEYSTPDTFTVEKGTKQILLRESVAAADEDKGGKKDKKKDDKGRPVIRDVERESSP